jgi:hypothetical protein
MRLMATTGNRTEVGMRWKRVIATSGVANNTGRFEGFLTVQDSR